MELVPVFAARWRSIRNISAAQITTTPREDYKNNCNARKVAPSYTQKMTLKQIQEELEQNYHIFQLKLKNARTRNNSQRSQQQTKDPFPFFYDANHLNLMTLALTRKNNNITPPQVQIIYSKEDLSNHNREISSKFRR